MKYDFAKSVSYKKDLEAWLTGLATKTIFAEHGAWFSFQEVWGRGYTTKEIVLPTTNMLASKFLLSPTTILFILRAVSMPFSPLKIFNENFGATLGYIQSSTELL